jgi:alanine dehydrogenase
MTLRYLSGPDIEALNMSAEEILSAIETSLRAQGNNQTVVEPRMHLVPDPGFNGHFNVLRGYIAPMDVAGVKVVGDFVDNYKQNMPSEFGILNLMDPRNGQPRAIMDATEITDMRTGAVTAIAGKYFAPSNPRVLANIGARGSSWWNVVLLDHLFDFEEIRVHSRRPESRHSFAERLTSFLGKPIVVTDNWQDCLDGADIMVEASRLTAPQPLFKTDWIKPGSLVVPYGTMSSVEDDITDVMDKIVVDDWGQATIGPFGCLRRHVDSGKVTQQSIHGELGQACAGLVSGRSNDDERILVWHRGLSTSDIALGQAMLDKAEGLGIGHVLPYR